MNSGGGSGTRASSSGGGGGWRGCGGRGRGDNQALRFDVARSSQGGASWRRQRTAWTSQDGACGAAGGGTATAGSLARTHRY